MQSSNAIDGSKRVTIDPKTTAYPPNNPTLPYWDNNEINKRLDEHARLLTEWEELLNRTGGVEVTSISQQDATRHILLKRKLHESLGVMARIVQNQLKMKKTATESAPVNTAPVLVTTTPTQNMYGQVASNGANGNNGGNMLLPSIAYQQQQGGNNNMDYNNNPQMMYNNGYNYQNQYVPNPSSGGLAPPKTEMMNQYYAYPTMNTAASHNQQVQSQQMYIPQYQMNPAGMSNNMPSSMNTNNGNKPGVVDANGNIVYGAYSSYPSAGGNYSMGMAQQMPQSTAAMSGSKPITNHSTVPPTSTSAAPQNYSYNTSGNVYPGTDGSSLLYSQQMLHQVPTSYYGNSSISNSTLAAAAQGSANHSNPAMYPAGGNPLPRAQPTPQQQQQPQLQASTVPHTHSNNQVPQQQAYTAPPAQHHYAPYSASSASSSGVDAQSSNPTSYLPPAAGTNMPTASHGQQ